MKREIHSRTYRKNILAAAFSLAIAFALLLQPHSAAAAPDDAAGIVTTPSDADGTAPSAPGTENRTPTDTGSKTPTDTESKTPTDTVNKTPTNTGSKTPSAPGTGNAAPSSSNGGKVSTRSAAGNGGETASQSLPVYESGAPGTGVSNDGADSADSESAAKTEAAKDESAETDKAGAGADVEDTVSEDGNADSGEDPVLSVSSGEDGARADNDGPQTGDTVPLHTCVTTAILSALAIAALCLDSALQKKEEAQPEQ